MPICGITEEELHTVFEEDIAMLTEEYECTPEEMRRKLKERYDDYHFSDKSTDIYIYSFQYIKSLCSEGSKRLLA